MMNKSLYREHAVISGGPDAISGAKFDDFVKSQNVLFSSFPPRTKYGINCGGNPVFSSTYRLPLPDKVGERLRAGVTVSGNFYETVKSGGQICHRMKRKYHKEHKLCHRMKKKDEKTGEFPLNRPLAGEC